MNEFDLDKELRQQMRRVDAPEGFADCVMGRLAQTKRGRLLSFTRGSSQTRHWLAVAAVLLVALMLGFGVHHVEEEEHQRHHAQEQAKARAAAQQFALAMQVTGRTLFVVQQRIDSAGTRTERGSE